MISVNKSTFSVDELLSNAFALQWGATMGAVVLLVGCRAAQPVVEHERVQIRPQEQEIASAELEPLNLPEQVDTLGMNPLLMPGKGQAGYVNPYPDGSYEHFAAAKEYPKTDRVYSDDRLLEAITVTNSKIIICLPQQRARLYVYGRVAMDWPVSTGTDGHETPTGVFRVMEKERNHHSGRYGKWVSSRGKVIDSNADITRGAPTGASFRPSSMPCWHRLTWDGVGIHGGRVVPGRRLSHGCIRSPYATARKLYESTVLGMPVYVSRAVEDYNNGGRVQPADVKYRPGGDHSDDVLPRTKS